MLSKSHILDILKNYVIYEVVNNKKIKKVAKHQQYRVVTKAIDRLHTDKKEKNRYPEKVVLYGIPKGLANHYPCYGLQHN